MMISYAICVCTEDRELNTLLNFLTTVKSKEDEIVVLVDRTQLNRDVENVLNAYRGIRIYGREFKNDFAEHKNFLNRKCRGEYIFNIDADEVPTEELINYVKTRVAVTNPDVLFVPRINICLGQTAEFLKRWKFQTNDMGWVNWPDYQGRVYRNSENIYWESTVHEKIGGPECRVREGCDATPKLSLMHVKTVHKQNKQNEFYDTL
jgi:hypothetical protein